MNVRTIVVGQLQTSCHIVTAGGSGPAVVIDPGASARRILRTLHEMQAVPHIILNTHGHVDHIGANQKVLVEYPDADFLIGERDAPMLADPSLNLSRLFIFGVKSPPPTRLLSEGDIVEIEGVRLEVLETPGHTPGGISLVGGSDAGGTVCFAGDTLFAGGIGRTDFPGGDHETLLASIREKLFALPPETVVYPGHGPATTIGREMRDNPFVAVTGPDNRNSP